MERKGRGRRGANGNHQQPSTVGRIQGGAECVILIPLILAGLKWRLC